VVIGHSMRHVDKAVASLRDSLVKIARLVSSAWTALCMTKLINFSAWQGYYVLLHSVCFSVEQGYIADSIRLIDCNVMPL